MKRKGRGLLTGSQFSSYGHPSNWWCHDINSLEGFLSSFAQSMPLLGSTIERFLYLNVRKVHNHRAPCKRTIVLVGLPDGSMLVWRSSFQLQCLTWTPHPAIVTIRDNGKYIRSCYFPIISLEQGGGSTCLSNARVHLPS